MCLASSLLVCYASGFSVIFCIVTELLLQTLDDNSILRHRLLLVLYMARNLVLKFYTEEEKTCSFWRMKVREAGRRQSEGEVSQAVLVFWDLFTPLL